MRVILIGAALMALLTTLNISQAQAQSDGELIKQGEYLTRLGGCGDCHSPGYFFGKADPATYLSGSDVGFQTPAGTFVGPNLTSDKETGLGNWSKEDIIKVLKTGTRPDGRVLADVMPWRSISQFKQADIEAIVTYLMSLEPVSHQVPGPLAGGEKPAFPVMTIVFPEGAAPPAQ